MRDRATPARLQRRRTAAAEAATGQFWCSSSNHFCTGEYVLIRGRKVCIECAAKRRQMLREARARSQGRAPT